ncbi:hypothetical protein ACHAXT_002073 [Thalassiosira profunda]
MSGKGRASKKPKVRNHRRGDRHKVRHPGNGHRCVCGYERCPLVQAGFRETGHAYDRPPIRLKISGDPLWEDFFDSLLRNLDVSDEMEATLRKKGAGERFNVAAHHFTIEAVTRFWSNKEVKGVWKKRFDRSKAGEILRLPLDESDTDGNGKFFINANYPIEEAERDMTNIKSDRHRRAAQQRSHEDPEHAVNLGEERLKKRCRDRGEKYAGPDCGVEYIGPGCGEDADIRKKTLRMMCGAAEKRKKKNAHRHAGDGWESPHFMSADTESLEHFYEKGGLCVLSPDASPQKRLADDQRATPTSEPLKELAKMSSTEYTTPAKKRCYNPDESPVRGIINNRQAVRLEDEEQVMKDMVSTPVRQGTRLKSDPPTLTPKLRPERNMDQLRAMFSDGEAGGSGGVPSVVTPEDKPDHSPSDGNGSDILTPVKVQLGDDFMV